jgi:FkbM family methyltransferase
MTSERQASGTRVSSTISLSLYLFNDTTAESSGMRFARLGWFFVGLANKLGVSVSGEFRSMYRAAADLVKRVFNMLGLEIRRRRPTDARPLPPRASLGGALRQLRSLGFNPHTVIDVGVAGETPELYHAFPKAKLLLIEPLVEFEPFLKQICRRYDAQYVLAAAGESCGSAIINVHTDQLDCSSLLKEAEGVSVDGTPREIPMVTIDEVCSEKGLKGPYLVKIDVQGAELKVLQGAQRVLKQTEAVLLEVTLFGTMIGGPQLADLVAYMKNRGLVVYDAWGFLYRPYDGALSQLDLAFVRQNGPFRKSHVYATPEQRKRLAADYLLRMRQAPF